MKKRLWWVSVPLIIAGLIVYQLWTRDARTINAALPGNSRYVLEHSQQLILYSLDPDAEFEKGHDERKAFVFYGVRGKLVITDPTVKAKIITALYQSITSRHSHPASCFVPHHGIRAVWQQQVVDIPICFDCNNMVVWFKDGNKPAKVLDQGGDGVPISNEARNTLDGILKSAGIPVIDPYKTR